MDDDCEVPRSGEGCWRNSHCTEFSVKRGLDSAFVLRVDPEYRLPVRSESVCKASDVKTTRTRIDLQMRRTVSMRSGTGQGIPEQYQKAKTTDFVCRGDELQVFNETLESYADSSFVPAVVDVDADDLRSLTIARRGGASVVDRADVYTKYDSLAALRNGGDFGGFDDSGLRKRPVSIRQSFDDL